MLGALLGAGVSALGSLIGGKQAQKSQEKTAAQNIALQKQFAQEGIQWKVKDAKKAGIHPLYALGASTQSFSPVAVGTPLGEGIAQAGQDIGRAIGASSSPETRVARATEALSIQRMELENQLLASQIARLNQAGTGPGIPTGGRPGDIVTPDGIVVDPTKGIGIGPSGVFRHVPGFASAEEWERSYGDITQEGAGLNRLAADWLNDMFTYDWNKNLWNDRLMPFYSGPAGRAALWRDLVGR